MSDKKKKKKNLVPTSRGKVYTDNLLLAPKKERNFSLEYIPSQVNAETFQSYLSMMEGEMKKNPTARDKKILATALEATFSDRRALINTNIMLSDLFSKYPALFTAEGINLDFKLMKNCNLAEMIFQGLSVCSSSVIQFAEKKGKKTNY